MAQKQRQMLNFKTGELEVLVSCVEKSKDVVLGELYTNANCFENRIRQACIYQWVHFVIKPQHVNR